LHKALFARVLPQIISGSAEEDHRGCIEDIMKEKNWKEPRRSAESSFSYPTNDDDESGVTVKFGKQVHKVKQSLSRGSNQ
jgi:hypothetical protein